MAFAGPLKVRHFPTVTSLQAFVNANLHAFPQGPALSPTDTDTINTIVSITHDTASGQYVLFYT